RGQVCTRLVRRLADVINIRHACKPQTYYHRLPSVFQYEVMSSIKNLLYTPLRLIVIYLPCLFDNMSMLGIIRYYKPWVNSNTVPTDTTSGLKYIYTWVFVCKSDKLPHIHTCIIADNREFVGKSYLYVT